MAQSGKTGTCTIVCWVIAIVAGLVAYMAARPAISVLAALLLAIALAVLLGLILRRLFCAGDAAQAAAGGHVTDAAAEKAAAEKAAADAAAAEKAAADAAAAEKAAADAAAAEKAAADAAAAEKAAADAAEAEKAAADAAAADEAPEEQAEAGPAVKPSTSLPGQAELAARKGEWKYQGGAGEADSAPEQDAPETVPDTAADTTPDYDGDGTREGTEEGTRPEALSGPREGGADNLKEIKGIGPALERLCNELGFYHFDQIANWTADEVAWVNANLQGFKGRVSRDKWVEQAKILAAGGETEFSKRVEDGDVY